MKRSTTWSAALASCGLLVAGLGATSALADPSGSPTYRVLAAQGSDTTQNILDGFSGVVLSNGSNYYNTGLLQATTLGATSINTSLGGIVSGHKLILDPAQEGSLSAPSLAGATSLTVTSNFTFVSGQNVVVTDGTHTDSGTISGVAGSNPTTLTVSAITDAFSAGAIVLGGPTLEVVTAGATNSSPVANTSTNGTTNAVNFYNVTVSATAYAHAVNALVIGDAVPASTPVVGSYTAVAGATQTKSNANCTFIADNGGTGTNDVGTASSGIVYGLTAPATILTNGTYALGVRANGSGSGAKALGDAQSAASPTWGCLDFSRASSAQAIKGATPGTSVNIPFAFDSMTFAITNTSNWSRESTVSAVQAAYKCTAPGEIPAVLPAGFSYQYTSTGNTITSTGTAITNFNGASQVVPAGVYSIQAFSALTGLLYAILPQAGSGTRGFWEGAMGITDANVTAGSYPCITDRQSNGATIEEHNQKYDDDRSIAPQSIAQAVAQRAAVVQTDNQSRAVLGVIDNTAASNGGTAVNDGTVDYPVGMTVKLGGGTQNPITQVAGIMWREVFNIVPQSSLVNPNVQAAFVGAGSAFCNENALLGSYGFAPDPNCGNTSYTK